MSSKILTENAQPLGNYPHLKQAGPFIYVSGTSSRRPDNTHVGAIRDASGQWQLDIRLQTEAVIKNIETILQSVGAGLEDIIDITTFLVEMKDFKGYNEVYGRFFNRETGPARTTVAVKELPHPNLLIEMKAIAYMGNSDHPS